MGGRAPASPRDRYSERLWAPPVWWLVTTAIVASLALAVGYPLGVLAGVATFVVVEGFFGWLLVRTAARVVVGDGLLVAGRATLPLTVVSAVTALDPVGAAALRGPKADARAFLLLRPWVRAAVRVDLDDPADRTPYWYVSTRDPAALAAATARAARLAAAGQEGVGGGADVADGPDGAG
jgi:hypothetical protein